MPIYQLISVNRKTTSTGKNMIKATVTDSDQNEIEDVTLWDSFPNFAMLAPTMAVEGDLVIKQDGKWENKTLYPKKSTTRTTRPKQEDMAKIMDKKAANIGIAMDKKSDAIKIAANARDATILTAQWVAQMTATGVSWTIGDMMEKWVEMRKWLSDNFGDTEAPF